MQTMTEPIEQMTNEQFLACFLELEAQESYIRQRRAQLIQRLTMPAADEAGTTAMETLITVAEAATRLDCSPRFFARNKHLPFVRRIHGKKLMVSEEALQQYLDDQRPDVRA
jgi:hypothetical protein